MSRSSTIQRTIPWGIAICALILTSAAPLALLAWLSEDPPELRVFVTGGDLSALIVDGHVRVLVINSDDREETIEAMGLMARPWEDAPNVLIASADDRLATGLWEALTRTDPDSVVVAGVPGAAPIWAAIEKECRERGIDLRYVAGTLTFSTARLSVTVFGPAPEASDASAVVVRHGALNSIITLGNTVPDVDARVAVANDDPGTRSLAVLISSRPVMVDASVRQAIVKERALIRVRFEDARVRIMGGTLLRRSDGQPTETSD